MNLNTCYLAGKMRGLPRFGFDAFEAAEKKLAGWGWTVYSPAQHDLDMGFDPDRPVEEQPDFDLKEAFAWDIDKVLNVDCVFVLDGWETSEGARIEVATALTVGTPVYLFRDGSPIKGLPTVPTADGPTTREDEPASPEGIDEFLDELPEWERELLDGEGESEPAETITAEAERLVYGDRGEAYGPPIEDFSRTAQMWSAIFGFEVDAKAVALAMVALKISREIHRPKRDNLVDLCGYALCAHRVETGL